MAECDSRQTKVPASASFMQDACRSKGVRPIQALPKPGRGNAGLVATSLQVIVSTSYLPGSGDPDDYDAQKCRQTPFERSQSGQRRLLVTDKLPPLRHMGD